MSPDDDKFVLALNEYIATGRTDEDHYCLLLNKEKPLCFVNLYIIYEDNID